MNWYYLTGERMKADTNRSTMFYLRPLEPNVF